MIKYLIFVILIVFFVSCSQTKSNEDIINKIIYENTNYRPVPRLVNSKVYCYYKKGTNENEFTVNMKHKITGNLQNLKMKLLSVKSNNIPLSVNNEDTTLLNKELISVILEVPELNPLGNDKYKTNFNIYKFKSEKDFYYLYYKCQSRVSTNVNYDWLETKGYYRINKNNYLISEGKKHLKNKSFFSGKNFVYEKAIFENKKLKKTIWTKVISVNTLIFKLKSEFNFVCYY